MFIFIAASTVQPLSIEPFLDEPIAASALEADMKCLASGAFEKRQDNRDVKVLSDQVIRGCFKESTALRAALKDVFNRKPELLPTGKQPLEAAIDYVSRMNGSVETVIIEVRKHR